MEELITYLEARSGLRFAGAQRDRMLEALATVAARSGHRAPDSHYRHLIDEDPAALGDLMDELTVPESHFFREPRSMALLQQLALPDAAAQRGPDGAIDVWCAGCAGGEEAYTVVMAAAEVGLGNRVQVLGTDVSPRSLAKAEAAVYGRWSLRGVSRRRRRRWFETHDGRYRVRDTIRQHVRFRSMNLLAAGPPGRFDVVLCRNVLIYFTPDAIERTGRLLRDAVRPGGWLLTGASDPPLALPGLELVLTPHGLTYRRVAEDAPPPPAARARPRSAGAKRRPAPAPGRALSQVAATRPPPAPGPPPTPSQEVREPSPAPSEVSDAPARVRSLGDAGRGEEALAVAEEAIAEDPLHAELWYLAAVLHLDAGRAADAAAAARAALFLDRDLAGAAAVLEHARQVMGASPDAVGDEGLPDDRT